MPRDPDGQIAVLPSIKYNYDPQGRLSFVQKLADRDNTNPALRYQTTSSYEYGNPNFPNYITAVKDGRGVPLTRNEYYPSVNPPLGNPGHDPDFDSRNAGRLMSVQAPDGTLTEFKRVYPTNEQGVPNSEFTDLNQGDNDVVAIEKVILHPVFDGSAPGNDSGIVTIHCADAKGNVLYTTDHLGNTIKRTYDDHNNVTKEVRIIEGGDDIETTYHRTYKIVQGKETDEVLQEITTAPRTTSGEVIQTRVDYENHLPKKSFDAKNVTSGTFYTENFYDGTTRQLLRTEARRLDQNGTPQTVTLLSKSVYHDSGTFKGMLDYTEDGAGTQTINVYYDSTEPTKGRFGDLKSVEVKSGATVLSKVSYEYDAKGNRAKEIKRRDAADTADGGHGSIVTQYIYDGQGRLKETIDAEATRDNEGEPTGAYGVSKIFYNSFGKVDYTEDRYGNQTSYTYGPNGDVIKTTYPDGSIVRSVSRHVIAGTGSTARRWKEVITEEPHFPLGHPRYNSAEPVRGSRSISDEIGRQIRSERLTNLDIGWVEVTTGELPRNTGLEIFKTTFNSADMFSWTQTKYNDAGQVESTEQGYIDSSSIAQTIPSTSTSFYDGNGRRYRVQTRLRNGAGTTDDEYTQAFYVFDDNGNQTHFCTIEGEAATAPALSDGRWTRYEYDDFNRRTKTYFPFLTGHTEATRYFTEIRYNILGQRIEEIDKAGVSTGYQYNELGQLITVTNAYRGFDASGNATMSPPDQTVTRYEYDWVGNMMAQIDANEVVKKDASQAYSATMFEYDNLGRRTKRTLPGGQIEEVDYDVTVSNGTRTDVRTDFNKNTITLLYDKRGRLQSKTPANGTGSTQTLTAAGLKPVGFTYTASGKRETMTDATGNSSYAYDDYGRLDTRTVNIGASSPYEFSYVLNYQYSPRGNLEEIKVIKGGNDQYAVTYRWDEINRLQDVFATGEEADTRTSYTYDTFGNLETVTYPAGTATDKVTTSYLYDQQHRLTDMYVKRGTGESTVDLAMFNYDDDTRLGPTGNRRSAKEKIWVGTASQATISRVVRYQYDNLYRLMKESIPSAQNASTVSVPTGDITYDDALSYSATEGYDRVGNRRSRTVDLVSGPATSVFGNKTYSYDSNDRLVSATHDANGNTRIGEVPEGAIVPATGNEDSYDSENRLVKRANSSKSIEIVYDGDGRRVKKTVTTSGVPATTYFINDDQNPTGYAQVLQEWKSGETQTSVSYIYGHDLISQTVPPVSPLTDPTTQYYGYDGHGNVRFLIDAAGVVKDTYTYDAFGTILHKTDADGVVVGAIGTFNITPNKYLYCGEQWDSDLGFYYLRARYLNPDSGRFWTMDTYEGSSQDPLSLHKYLYCHANPLNNIDPSGNVTIGEMLKVFSVSYTLRAMALRGTVAMSFQALFQLRLYKVLFPLSQELHALSESLSGVDSKASERIREVAEAVRGAISPGTMAWNIGMPTAAAVLHPLASATVFAVRVRNLNRFVESAMAATMEGMQHDDGTHYFSFKGDIPAFRSSGARAFVGAYDPADDIKPMRLFVEAWKSRDVREIERQFLRTGRRLAKYGDYSGSFGMRGWVHASSDTGGASGFGTGSVLFDTENGKFTYEKIGTLDGFMQH